MKKSKLIHSLLLLLFISIFISCNDDSPMDNSTKINVTTPGTLKDVLGFDYLSMTKLTIQGTINGDDINTIRNITGLTHLDIKDVFIIEGGNYLGYNPHNTKDVIPAEMFSNMTKLQVVILPRTVLSIEPNAFQHCTDLRMVEIPNNVKSISLDAFSNCTSLNTITLPGVRSIAMSFRDCTNLKTVIFGSEIEYIYPITFYNSLNIEEYHIKAINPPQLQYYNNDDTFSGVDKRIIGSVTLFIPKGSKEAYQNNKGWKGFKDYIEKY